MTQTNNISLMDHFDAEMIADMLEDSLTWLDTEKAEFKPEIFEALTSRISLRQAMLIGFTKDVDEYYAHKDIESMWPKAKDLAFKVESSHSLGQPVDEAWSTSVQRKLASQVPPRPIVDIPFEQAIATLKQMCEEMLDIPKILKYESTSSVIVCMTWRTRRGPNAD